MLSDGGIDASSLVVTPAATDAVVAADADNGWFGFLTGPIEGLLKLIHVGLTSMGLSADAWGVSIIVMTIVIKVLTFPLTKSQLESTNKMQVRLIVLVLLQLEFHVWFIDGLLREWPFSAPRHFNLQSRPCKPSTNPIPK